MYVLHVYFTYFVQIYRYFRFTSLYIYLYSGRLIPSHRFYTRMLTVLLHFSRQMITTFSKAKLRWMNVWFRIGQNKLHGVQNIVMEYYRGFPHSVLSKLTVSSVHYHYRPITQHATRFSESHYEHGMFKIPSMCIPGSSSTWKACKCQSKHEIWEADPAMH